LAHVGNNMPLLWRAPALDGDNCGHAAVSARAPGRRLRGVPPLRVLDRCVLLGRFLNLLRTMRPCRMAGKADEPASFCETRRGVLYCTSVSITVRARDERMRK